MLPPCGSPRTSPEPARRYDSVGMTAYDPVPAKHPEFIFYEKEPYNGGPPPWLARGAYVTPHDLFYVRCHGDIPVLDAGSHRLYVRGHVARPLVLSLETLRGDFPAHTVAATLQCAGNRRDELIADRGHPRRGPVDRQRHLARRLDRRAAGRRAGPAPGSIRRRRGSSSSSGTTKPSKRATRPSVGRCRCPRRSRRDAARLRARRPAAAAHPRVSGARHRAGLPRGAFGQVAARDQRARPSLGQPFPGRGIPAPSADGHEGGPRRRDGARRWPRCAVNSYICRVHRGQSGRRRPDGGRGLRLSSAAATRSTAWRSPRTAARHWTRAELLPPPADGPQAADEEGGRWSWRFWRAELPAAENVPVQIVVRAWDTAANVQPERAEDCGISRVTPTTRGTGWCRRRRIEWQAATRPSGPGLERLRRDF